ncbi:MAG: ATP-binding protein, partial [Hymenobacter sp.]
MAVIFVLIASTMTLKEVLTRRESEHKIEFKEAKTQYPYKGGSESEPAKRRRCVLGYVVGLANEGGGTLAFGVQEGKGNAPHTVVGSIAWEGREGQLTSDIYRDKGIRVEAEVLRDELNRRVLLLHVDRRPVGQVYKFEDVPLMRVGDQLLPMSDA